MTDFFTDIVAFIVLISILVAVHEYGHYIVGRWTGMKVLRFSIGFGKPILMHIGGKDKTEYCVSAIPLGGYVRFLDSREGNIDPEDEGRAFDQRPIPARIAVLLAGPGFNFLFAIAAYWVLMSPTVVISQPAVGDVKVGSYAAEAGLVRGDKIIAVGDSATDEWEETLIAILGEMVDDGKVPLTLETAAGEQRLAIIDVGDEKTRLTEPGQLFDGIGFEPWRRPALIGKLIDDGVAIQSGLEVGDLITKIDHEEVGSFDDLIRIVSPSAGKSIAIEFVRNGEPHDLQLTVGYGGNGADGEPIGRLGIESAERFGDYYYRRENTTVESLLGAIDKTWASTAFTVQMLGRMVTGDVSIKNISGPINIAQIAGASVERGWRYFVGILAIISISLGVLNLLPIPVLDGGQIVYQMAEALKGSPLTERTQIIGQQLGIFALLLLMSFAFYNDIFG